MFRFLIVTICVVYGVWAADRCDTDLHPTLQVKGTCMEISDCNARGGIYEHNWCMSKATTVKCCFKKEEEIVPETNLLDFNAQCAYEGQLLPHPNPLMFYKCSHGWKFALDCPIGQVWYQAKQWCDYPGMDYGWADLFQSLLDGNYFDYFPTVEDLDDESDWDFLLDELDMSAAKAKGDRCDTEEHPQYGKGTCQEKSTCDGVYVDNWCQSKAASIKCCFSSQKWETICQNGGIQAHQDPTKYIKCINGKQVPLSCPQGTVFMSDLKTCDVAPVAGTNTRRVSVSFLRHPQVEGIRNDAYCLPPDQFPKSGVTIGIGVDFGSKDAQSLRAAGVSESIIQKVTPYFGKTGQAACTAARVTNPLVLSEADTLELSDAIIRQESDDVAKKYNVARGSSAKAFDDLTCSQRTVIASVLYQYGNPTRVPKFWSAVTSNDWAQVIKELRNFGDAHATRRNLEADLLENDSGVKNCPSPTTDTCLLTKGTCAQRSSCGGKVIPNFCQFQATSVVCCLSGASSGPVATVPPATRVASIRTTIADEAWNAANDKSQGLCARYVREAIERGYEKVTGSPLALVRTTSAKDYGPSLIKAGFKVVSEPLEKGDVVIFGAVEPKHPHGHIAIYTGSKWVSDFKQNSIYAASAYSGTTPTYYRYFGK